MTDTTPRRSHHVSGRRRSSYGEQRAVPRKVTRRDSPHHQHRQSMPDASKPRRHSCKKYVSDTYKKTTVLFRLKMRSLMKKFFRSKSKSTPPPHLTRAAPNIPQPHLPRSAPGLTSPIYSTICNHQQEIASPPRGSVSERSSYLIIRAPIGPETLYPEPKPRFPWKKMSSMKSRSESSGATEVRREAGCEGTTTTVADESPSTTEAGVTEGVVTTQFTATDTAAAHTSEASLAEGSTTAEVKVAKEAGHDKVKGVTTRTEAEVTGGAISAKFTATATDVASTTEVSLVEGVSTGDAKVAKDVDHDKVKGVTTPTEASTKEKATGDATPDEVKAITEPAQDTATVNPLATVQMPTLPPPRKARGLPHLARGFSEWHMPAATDVIDFAYPPGHPLRHGPAPVEKVKPEVKLVTMKGGDHEGWGGFGQVVEKEKNEKKKVEEDGLGEWSFDL